MIVRGGLVLGALLLTAPGAVATAPARPTCPLLSDPRGDQTPPSDQAADLISVDLAANRQAMTVVVGYGGEQPATAPVQGHMYRVDLDDGESAVAAWAGVAPDGQFFELYRTATAQGNSSASASAGTAIGALEGSVDPVRHLVRMRVPLALAPDVLSWGHRLSVSAHVFTEITTPSLPVVGQAFASNGSDDSDTSARYRVGAPGCVRPA